MKNIIKWLFFLELINYFGCNNENFSPYGEYRNSNAIYCILDTRYNTQFVKIQKTYLENDFNKDTINNKFGNIKVTMYDAYGKPYIFRDTVISGIDNYRTFYTTDLFPMRKTKYILYISSLDSKDSLSTVSIPSVTNVYADDRFNYIGINFSRNDATANLFQMFIDYEITTDEKTYSGKIEVPFSIRVNSNDTTIIYPKVFKKDEVNDYFTTTEAGEMAKYPRENLIYTFSQIKSIRIYKNIKIKRSYLYVFSFDKNFYNYLAAVNGYYDQYSVRLDRPNWTNFKDGCGLFGALAIDSSNFRISTNLIEQYGLINEQP